LNQFHNQNKQKLSLKVINLRPLFKIIHKNFKLLIRSKSSALIIILGPLLVIFLVGIAFDNINKYSINIGTYSSKYNELTESFISKLQEKDYKVQKFNSEEECVESIKQSKIHTCIIFPPDIKIEPNKVNEITFYIDNSKINLVWMILDTLSSKLEERSSELSTDLTKGVLDKLDFTKQEISLDKPVVIDLQTENTEITNNVNELNKNMPFSKISSLKNETTKFKEFIIGKLVSINDIVKSIEGDIDSLPNVTTSDKSFLKDQTKLIKQRISELLIEVDTSKGDYSEIVNSLNEIESSFKSTITSMTNSIESKLSQSSSKINKIKSSLDNIYNTIEGVKIKNAATIVNPITTNIKSVVSEKSYLNYMFPALIVLAIMFISILLSTTLVMMEKHSPAYFRNFITPTRNITFILGTYFTNIILVVIQLIIIVSIALIFFKSQILSTLPVIGLLLFLTTSFFTFAGMLIGSIFTSEETSTLASISLGSIFLFLSDVILPIESMPGYIQNIVHFNPFVLAENLLRRVILFQSKISVIADDIYLLLSYSVAVLILILLIHTFARKHLLFKIEMHKKHKRVKK